MAFWSILKTNKQKKGIINYIWVLSQLYYVYYLFLLEMAQCFSESNISQ